MATEDVPMAAAADTGDTAPADVASPRLPASSPPPCSDLGRDACDAEARCMYREEYELGHPSMRLSSDSTARAPSSRAEAFDARTGSRRKARGTCLPTIGLPRDTPDRRLWWTLRTLSLIHI